MAEVPPVAQPVSAEDECLIKDGDHVVFDEHGDKKSLVVIKRNGYGPPAPAPAAATAGLCRVGAVCMDVVQFYNTPSILSGHILPC